MPTSIEEFARKLDRPVDAWPALAELDPADIDRLGMAVDEACESQSRLVDEALGQYFLPFLRDWLVRWLRGGKG